MAQGTENETSLNTLDSFLLKLTELQGGMESTVRQVESTIDIFSDITKSQEKYVSSLEKIYKAGIDVTGMDYEQARLLDERAKQLDLEIRLQKIQNAAGLEAESNAKKAMQSMYNLSNAQIEEIDKVRKAQEESTKKTVDAIQTTMAAAGGFVFNALKDMAMEAFAWTKAGSSLALQGSGSSRTGGMYDMGVMNYAKGLGLMKELGFSAQESQSLGSSMISSNTFMDNTRNSKDYSDAMVEAGKAARAFGISTADSAKIMKDSFRYNDGEYKQIMAGLNQVMSETSFNGLEVVTNFSKLNAITSRYANNMQTTTTLMTEFEKAIQKGQISMEQLDFSTRKQPLGKDTGLAYLAGMSEKGQVALQKAGVSINGNPLDTERQMFMLNETKEGQLQLANIMRNAMSNLVASTGESGENQRLLLQRGVGSGILPSSVSGLLNSLSDNDLTRFMNNEITLDRKTWSQESQDKYDRRIADMSTEALANAAVQDPTKILIMEGVKKISEAVKDGRMQISDSEAVNVGAGQGVQKSVKSLQYVVDPRQMIQDMLKRYKF